MINKIKNKGQVWIETVLYTLIGLALIGLVLAFATPKINESRDSIIIEQSIESLKVFDDKVNFVIARGAGNVGVIDDFILQRGQVVINALNNSITFVIKDLSKPYTEPGIPVKYGRITIISEEGAKTSSVNLSVSYNANITYEKKEDTKILKSAATPYRFSIENINNIYINIEDISR